MLLLAGNAVSTFLQTSPSAYILFAYVLILTSICFAPFSTLEPPTICPQATFQPVPATNAALHHGVALALLSRLLPGSEHLAHELLLSFVFRLEFLP